MIFDVCDMLKYNRDDTKMMAPEKPVGIKMMEPLKYVMTPGVDDSLLASFPS